MTSNYFRLFSLLLFIAVYLFSFIPIVSREVFRAYNPLRNMSRLILAILCISLLTLLPSVTYQLSLIMTAPEGFLAALRTMTTYTSTIGGYANLVLLWLVLHYKYRGE